MNGTSGPTSPRVGNLIEAGANPPITAEMISNADRNDELTCCARFARFQAEWLIALIGNREFGWVAQLAWVEANRTV